MERMTTRIPPLEPPYAPEVEEDLRKLMPPGVAPLALFRTVAHNPRVLGRLRRGGLLDPGSISVREREIVILRTTARCGAEYEWGVHVHFFARAAGLSDAQVAATVHDADVWSPRERLLIELADALHESAAVPEPLWAALAVELRPAQLIELVTLAGLYHMVSFLVRATQLPPEPGAARFPP
jgi:alkylhydroperoxidase family enzyme